LEPACSRDRCVGLRKVPLDDKPSVATELAAPLAFETRQEGDLDGRGSLVSWAQGLLGIGEVQELLGFGAIRNPVPGPGEGEVIPYLAETGDPGYSRPGREAGKAPETWEIAIIFPGGSADADPAVVSRPRD
jgi:hypothetical protein